MRYMGGKNRTGLHIARIISDLRDKSGCKRVEDRCCGSLAVSSALWSQGVKVSAAFDLCEPLIRMFEAVRDGWNPPCFVTPEEQTTMHELHRDLARAWRQSANFRLCAQRNPHDPLVAFIGFFCCYGGKFFSGLCPDDERFEIGTRARHASVTSSQDLIAMRPLLRHLQLHVGDCFDKLPKEPSTLYFDPPYAETEGYAGVPPFDSHAFFECAAQISDQHAVIVSEFAAPRGWLLAAEITSGSPGMITRGEGAHAAKKERLFVRKNGIAAKALCLS